MKEYIYRFADGVKSVVEVTDELYDLLVEMDMEERFGNRKETRRHVSLEELQENGIEIVDTKADILFVLERIKTENLLNEALATLTERQREVFVLYEESKCSFTEIGHKFSVGKDTIKESYWAAIKKLRTFFDKHPLKL